MVESDRPQMAIRRMSIACCITKATDKHSECHTYCISAAKMVIRKHVNVTLLCTLPAWLLHVTVSGHIRIKVNTSSVI